MIIPRQVKVFDTLELISILGISKETLEKNIHKCKHYSNFKASILISQITDSKYARLQENYTSIRVSLCRPEHYGNTM